VNSEIYNKYNISVQYIPIYVSNHEIIVNVIFFFSSLWVLWTFFFITGKVREKTMIDKSKKKVSFHSTKSKGEITDKHSIYEMREAIAQTLQEYLFGPIFSGVFDQKGN